MSTNATAARIYEYGEPDVFTSRNTSNTQPAKLLAVFVADTGDDALTTLDHVGGAR